MGVTASRLKQLGLIDEIVPEPLGGAHRDVDAMAETLNAALATTLNDLCAVPLEELVDKRAKRLMQYGEFEQA